MHPDLKTQLGSASQNFYFGSEGFNIAAYDELRSFQVGYAEDTDGQSLVTGKEGDWEKPWVVFGRLISLGDPFCVNTENEQLRVFALEHGMDTWQPEAVSESLAGFLAALRHLQEISGQSAELIDPSPNTPSKKKKVKAIRKEVIELSGKSSKAYWKGFFDIYMDWIEESGY